MSKKLLSKLCGILLLVTGAEGGESSGTLQVSQVRQLRDVANNESKTVKVSGAVEKPGVVVCVKELTLDQAIKAAGGFSNTANRKKIQLTRNGKVRILSFYDAKNQKLRILPGDKLEVMVRIF